MHIRSIALAAAYLVTIAILQGCYLPHETAAKTASDESLGPPPTPTSSMVLSEKFLIESKTLGDVDKRLVAALSPLGYTDLTYFEMANGYALITAMEGFDDTGKSTLEPHRWSCQPPPLSGREIRTYVKALADSRVGHFRVFLFAVCPAFVTTDEEVNFKSYRAIQKNGERSLPERLAQRDTAQSYRCHVLVYEFVRPSGASEPYFECHSGLSAGDHLNKSGIAAGLTK
ncbi:MAG: hypothetical protein QM783_02760 [Phycisphaerales bacterium]